MSPATIMDLTGAGWRLMGGHYDDLPVAVPVHALQALHDAELAPDPLYRYSDFRNIQLHSSIPRCAWIRWAGVHATDAHVPPSVTCWCRYNENELRWAALQIWNLNRAFNIEESLLADTCVDLLLSGVDTVADIQLNGQHLLRTDNAFRYVLALQNRSSVVITSCNLQKGSP
jgi:hypothetical protein